LTFSTRPEGFEHGLRVIESILLEPTFPEAQLLVEKRRVIASIRSRREDGFELAMERLRLITYRGTSYEVAPAGKGGGCGKGREGGPNKKMATGSEG
jgi:zinc protease